MAAVEGVRVWGGAAEGVGVHSAGGRSRSAGWQTE